MSYRVVLTVEAEADLLRLFDFLIEQALASDDDLDIADQAVGAIRAALQALERFPFSCRKVGPGPFLRELVIPFGHTGYVALFEIVDPTTVVVGAVRHQREDDYH